MTYLNFLLEQNYDAANIVSTIGYSKMLKSLYGINCEVKNSDISYLEYKYKLDKNICD